MNYTKCLLNDLNLLEEMVINDAFEKETIRIGAEQEMTLIGKDYFPSHNYESVLSEVNDPRFTTELAKFNIETVCCGFVLCSVLSQLRVIL